MDKELAPSRMAEMAAHLASCPDCRREFASLGAVWEQLGALASPEPRRGLEAAVMSRIAQEEKNTLPPRLIPASLCAAAIGLFLGVFLANSAIQRIAEPMIAADDNIMREMDVFAPSPQGSLSSGYFAMEQSSVVKP
jgi:anti-sigma factor RsiW